MPKKLEEELFLENKKLSAQSDIESGLQNIRLQTKKILHKSANYVGKFVDTKLQEFNQELLAKHFGFYAKVKEVHEWVGLHNNLYFCHEDNLKYQEFLDTFQTEISDLEHSPKELCGTLENKLKEFRKGVRQIGKRM